MVYVGSAAVYIVNHISTTVVRAKIRLKSYRYKYGGNTTLKRCIKRRVLRKRTVIYAIIITLIEVFLFYNYFGAMPW